MIELIMAYGLLGVQQAASIMYGLIRTKVLAIFLGPFGVGVIAQANTFMEMLQQVATLGVGGGFTKLVAEHSREDDPERLNKTIVTTLVLFSVVGLIVVGLSTLFAEEVALWAFDRADYGLFVIIAAVAGFFLVQYRLLTNIFRGLLHWREYSIATIVGYMVSVVPTIALIYYAGLVGAVFSMLAAQGVNFGIGMYMMRKTVAPKHQLSIRHWPDWGILQYMIRFVAPLASIALLSSIARFSIRAEIIQQLGADANGIYQTVWGISIAYMGFILNTTWSYGMPKAATLVDTPDDIVEVQNNGLRLSFLLLAPFTVALLAARELWIPVLYSSAFLVAGQFMIWQFSGDLLLAVRKNLNMVLLPLERLRFLFVEGLSFWVSWTAISFLLIPRMGIQAVLTGYFAVNLGMLVVALLYHSFTTAFHLSRENLGMLAKGLPLVAAGMLVSQFVEDLAVRIGIVAVIVAMMAAWLPTAEERRKGWAFVRERLSRGK